MNKDGVVSIGIEYKKEFNQMINDYESALSEMASNKTLSKGMKAQFENVIAELRSFKAEMDKQLSDLSVGKVDVTKFESFKKSVSKKFESINGDISTLNTAVSLLNEKMDMVGNGIDLSKVQNEFKGLEDYINRTNDAVSEFVKRMDGQGIHLFSYDKTNQKEIQSAIKMIDSELRNIDKDYGAKFELFDEKEAQNELDKLATELRFTMELLDSAKSRLSNIDSSSDIFKKTTGEITALELKAARLSDTMEILYDTASEKKLSIDITDDKNLASYDKYIDELSIDLDDVSKSAERAKKELSSLLGDIKSINSVKVSDKLNPNSAQLITGLTIEADSDELWKKISPVLTDLRDKLNSNPVIAPVKLVVAPTAVSQNNNPDQSISTAYSKKYAKKLAQTGEDAIIDMDGVYKKTYTSIMNEAVKCAEESITKIQGIFEKAPIDIKLQLSQEELDKINNFVLSNKDEKKIDISGQVNKVKTDVSELNDKFKETTELIQKASQNKNIKFNGIEEFTKQITNSLSSLEKLQDILITLQNVEITLANANGLSSITEINNQWESLSKRINNAIKLDGTFRKNANVGKLAEEYQKYLDMGGKNELSSISKLKDNEIAINTITSKMKELSSQKVDTTSVNKIDDSFDKIKSSLDDIILKLNSLGILIKNIGNTFYKIFKDASVGDIDKQWSSIESKFKSITDESGKINLSKQKKDVQELMEMYQKYSNAGGMKTPFDLTDNAETIKKLNKVYEQLNETKVQSTSDNKTVSDLSEVDKSVDSLTNNLENKLSQASNIAATAMEDSAERQILALTSVVDNINMIVDGLKKIKGVKIPTIKIDDGSEKKSSPKAETNILLENNPRKDAIQTDGSSATNASTSAIKEENNVLDQTAQSAEKAANSKKKFAKANKEVKDSADTSKNPIKNEASSLKEVADSTNQLNIIQAKSDSTYWQNRFKESVKDMTSTNDELVKMKKYYQDMSNEAQKAYDTFEKQKKSYSDKLTKYTDTSKYTSDFVNRANNLKSKIETFDFTKPQDVARLKEIDVEVNKINNDSKLLENKLIRQQSKLAEIVSQMKIFKSQNTNMSNSQKTELEQVINYAETMRKSGKEVASEVEKIKVQFAGLKARVNETGNMGKNFFSQISNRLTDMNSKFVAQFLSWQDWIRYIQQGINTIRELDEAMTEVRKVSEASESQYESFQKTIASTAKEIASTNKELLNSSADFLRLGYSLDQAENLAKNATLFVNVGDGVDVNAATEDMITAMKAFDIKAENSIKIVDDYNQIGNMYALSATDIGEAMKRSASALETGNNTFEESIALITAMNEIVQNSENTGNTLKVFSLRLRGAKAELEAMSEDTDGLCESSSKLREQLQALTGVDIMLNDNTFKSTTQITKELGAVWDKLSDSSQAATLELIAGKTRANNVAALLKNYKQIDNVISDLDDAEGSALRENEAIVDSINGRIKTLSATVEEFWQSFIDTDTVKNVVSLASDMLSTVTKIIDKVHILPTLFAGITAVLSAKNNFGKCYVSA